MMRFALNVLAYVIGFIFLALGMRYLIDPEGASLEFGLQALSANGLATIRADMFALFGAAGIAAIAGAWLRDRRLLLVPAGICALALCGRIVSFFNEGASDGMITAMGIELFAGSVFLASSQLLPTSKPNAQSRT